MDFKKKPEGWAESGWQNVYDLCDVTQRSHLSLRLRNISILMCRHQELRTICFNERFHMFRPKLFVRNFIIFFDVCNFLLFM